MKKNKFLKVSAILFSLALMVGLWGVVKAATAVNLATADNFAVLAGSAISDAAPTGVITGDVGLSPAAGSNITGLTGAQVSGTIYAVDATGPDGVAGNNPGLLITAKNDLSSAYTNAAGQPSDFALNASTTDSFAGTGYTLEAGVYTSASSIGITGTLTLDAENNPNAVFIFQAGSTLTTATNSEVVLINGAQACNIFWQVGSSATLGTTSSFAGTIMAVESITDDGGSTVAGRLLADADNDGAGAVTLSNTNVVVPSCAPSLTLLKTVTNDNGGNAANTDWTLTATGTGASPTNLSGTTPVSSNVIFPAATFKADTYTLGESSAPSGYTASTYSCVTNGGAAVVSNSITLARGQSATCTITNDDNASFSSRSSGSSRRTVLPVLHVVKHVINDNGGLSNASLFNLHVKLAGVEVAGSPAFGISSPGRSYTLSSGTYVVSEDFSNGYRQSFSGDCDANGSVTLFSGDNKTCVVINDDIAQEVTPVTSTVAPKFSKTGFPPKDTSAPHAALGVLVGSALLFLIIRQGQSA